MGFRNKQLRTCSAIELGLFHYFFFPDKLRDKILAGYNNSERRFLVRVSYYEIYNEEIRDLLTPNSSASLEVKERPDVGTYIKNLTTHVVNNAEEMDRIMTIGNKNRVIGASRNVQSLKSHAIFTITVETSVLGVDNQHHIKMGRLHLVDLANVGALHFSIYQLYYASSKHLLDVPSLITSSNLLGSERQNGNGHQTKEPTKINLSLSTLGNVISALVHGQCEHIPYKNSKLTRILQESLGRHVKKVITKSTQKSMRSSCEKPSSPIKVVRNKSSVIKLKTNENPKDELLRRFRIQINELKRKLAEQTSQVSCESRKKSEAKFHPRTKTRANCSRDLELQKTKIETEVLKMKLQSLQQQIIIGGENLLEKAEKQEHLLEVSAKELEERVRRERELRFKIEKHNAERFHIEEKYSKLRFESAQLDKTIKQVTMQLNEAKDALKDIRQENTKDIEGMLENVKTLTKKLALQETIEKMFIPSSYKQLIEKHTYWNKDINEWELKCAAYTGNPVTKYNLNERKSNNSGKIDLLPAFHYYIDMMFVRKCLPTTHVGVIDNEARICLKFLAKER